MSVLSASCAHIPPRGPLRPPQSLPPSLIERYRVPETPLREERRQTEALTDYRLHHITLLLSTPTVPAGTPTLAAPLPRLSIDIEFYETTRSGRRPAILVVPILSGAYPIERSFCRFFARQGFHAVLVRREPMDFGSERGAAYVEEVLAQAVAAHRVVVRWLQDQPSVDAERLGAFGISMGGVIGVITAAVEPSLKAHVIALAGGSIADIFRTTSDPTLTIPRDRYLQRSGSTAEQFHEALAATVATDPLRLAPYVDPGEILFIAARLDRTIRPRHGLQLWRALGRPELVRLPSGHYSSIIWLPYVRRVSLRFFRRRLDWPSE